MGGSLVALQGFIFVAVVAGALVKGVGPRLASSNMSGYTVAALGVVGLVASGRHLGRALTSYPMPNGSGLVAHGLYRWVRHPIYTSILITYVGVAIAAGTMLTYIAITAQIVVFEVKTRLEERWLAEMYEGYEEYAARTGKYVPGLGKRKMAKWTPEAREPGRAQGVDVIEP